MYALQLTQYKHGIQVILLPILLVTNFHEAEGFLNGLFNFNPFKTINNLIKPGVTSAGHRICETEGCVRKASQILTNMNVSVDPCDNFYEFACGNFKNKELAVPAGILGSNLFSILSENKVTKDLLDIMERLIDRDILIRTANTKEPRFYQLIRNCFNSCHKIDELDKIGLDPMKAKIKAMKGWPVTSDESPDEYNFSRGEIVKAVYEAGFIFQNLISVKPSEIYENSTKRLLVTSPYGLFASDLPDPLIKSAGGLLEPCYTGDMPRPSLLNFAVNLATIFGASNPVSTKNDMQKVLKLECDLFKLSLKDELINIHDRLRIKVMAKDLMFPKFDIEALLRLHNISMNPNEPVINVSPNYTSQLGSVLDAYDTRTLHNYLVYRVVGSMAHLLDSNTVTLFQDTFEIGSRSTWCVAYTHERFSHGITQLYLNEHISPQIRAEMKDMAKRIQDSVRLSMSHASWMDDQTRAKAIEKLDGMLSTIIYLDEFLDPGTIDKLYEKMHWNGSNLIDSELNYHFTAFGLNNLREPFDRYSWKERHPGKNAILVNAFYEPTKNLFMIPPTVAQYPLFALDVPQYINYGSVGAILGHEISHAFDYKGSLFDKDGNPADWWQPETKEKFKKKQECFIKQYDNLFLFRPDLKINGTKTLGDNMADNFGFIEAYNALNAWNGGNNEEPLLPGLQKYTRKQMFWLSLASWQCSKFTRTGVELEVKLSHSPLPIRLIGSLSNYKEFADDFNCPPGSKMNPIEKCDRW